MRRNDANISLVEAFQPELLFDNIFPFSSCLCHNFICPFQQRDGNKIPKWETACSLQKYRMCFCKILFIIVIKLLLLPSYLSKFLRNVNLIKENMKKGFCSSSFPIVLQNHFLMKYFFKLWKKTSNTSLRKTKTCLVISIPIWYQLVGSWWILKIEVTVYTWLKQHSKTLIDKCQFDMFYWYKYSYNIDK